MSGGHFNYANDDFCNELFDYNACPDYGLGSSEYYNISIRNARSRNPMEDKLLSEMVYDMFCLLHSLDWYKSGDTDEDVYRNDVNYFKRKYLCKTNYNIVNREIDRAVNELRDELTKTLLWNKENEDG